MSAQYKSEWFGTIQNEVDADRVLGKLGKDWFILAGLFGIVVLFLYITMGIETLWYLSDVGICGFAGYVLPRYRSRCFSILLSIYALSSSAITCAAYFGLYQGIGKNIILAIFITLIGFRGVYATIVWHRSVGSITVWKNVAIMMAIYFVVSVSVFVGIMVAYVSWVGFRGSVPSDEATGMWFLALLLLSWLGCYFLLRNRFPWGRQDGQKREPSPNVQIDGDVVCTQCGWEHKSGTLCMPHTRFCPQCKAPLPHEIL